MIWSALSKIISYLRSKSVIVNPSVKFLTFRPKLKLLNSINKMSSNVLDDKTDYTLDDALRVKAEQMQNTMTEQNLVDGVKGPNYQFSKADALNELNAGVVVEKVDNNIAPLFRRL